MATRALKKSSKKTPLRDVGRRKLAKTTVSRNARATKAPRPEVNQSPTDRAPQDNRHGEQPNIKANPIRQVTRKPRTIG
jgi:hypothetical protein